MHPCKPVVPQEGHGAAFVSLNSRDSIFVMSWVLGLVPRHGGWSVDPNLLAWDGWGVDPPAMSETAQ